MKRFLQWVREYARTFAKSVSDLRFYRTVGEKRPGEAIGHVAVALAVLWMIPFLVGFFVGARTFIDMALTSLRTHVPAGTVFEVQKGAFTNTLEQPLVFREGKTVFIINTATTTLELAEDEYGFAVGSATIVQKKSPVVTETVKWSSAPEFRLTREDIDERITRGAKWFLLIAAFFVTAVVAVTLAFAYGVIVLVHALALRLVFRIARRPVPGFRAAFVTAAYAATIHLTAKAILTLFDIRIGYIPLLLYWVLLGLIVYDAAKAAPAAPTPPPPAEPQA